MGRRRWVGEVRERWVDGKEVMGGWSDVEMGGWRTSAMF